LVDFAGRCVGLARPNYRATIKRDPCVWCNQYPLPQGSGKWAGTIEHVIPRSLGGPDNIDNIASACSACNNSRGSMSILQCLVKKRHPLNRKILAKPNLFSKNSSWGCWIKKQKITISGDYFWRFGPHPPTIPWYDLPILHGGWRR
jgi:hypothetical protein